MADRDVRFHLQPILKRYSLDELQQREAAFLSRNNRYDFGLPAPNANLQLVIVIPALNEEKTIGRVLNCLVAQGLSHDRFEVIVVDNGSTDGTKSVVLNFVRDSNLAVHLVSEPIGGCLQAVRTGMDVALHRLAQVPSPQEGIIAAIDADDQVGPHWATAVHENIGKKEADMIRGPTQIAKPLPVQVELCVKTLCDVENRVNGYVELARLRIREILSGIDHQSCPLWLPRITGPNIAITRAAYVAVGGLDPRPPGDQASHLANPLLRLGGNFGLCEDPRMILFRSGRRSRRNFNQAGGFGVGFGLGFAHMLECAAKAVAEQRVINYPNPAWVEEGLTQILVGLQADVEKTRDVTRNWAIRFLDAPPDPNMLYRRGSSSEEPAQIPVAEAQTTLIQMTARANGMDYRVAERFLMTREKLRREILSINERQWIQSDRIADTILETMGFPSVNAPLHHRQMATALKKLPNAQPEVWYDKACRMMEQIYARVTL